MRLMGLCVLFSLLLDICTRIVDEAAAAASSSAALATGAPPPTDSTSTEQLKKLVGQEYAVDPTSTCRPLSTLGFFAS